MSKGLPIFTLRLAVVINVTKTYVECEYLGHIRENRFECMMPHPYTSGGGGFLSGIENGTVVVVGVLPPTRSVIIATVPLNKSYFDQADLIDTNYFTTPLPNLDQGELMMKSSKSNSMVNLLTNGRVLLDGGAGNYESDLELSPIAKTFFVRPDNKYTFTEAGRNIDGVIKRDKNKFEDHGDTTTINFLTGNSYERLLSYIGRSPADEVQARTTTILRDFIRNPALVEKRELVYEYADSFGVGRLPEEEAAVIHSGNMTGIDDLVKESGRRQDRRTDTLNLDLSNYNHLIETTKGTVVDIYGNILDINRNVIDVPDINVLGTKVDKSSESGLKDIYRYLRRSIKYHFEINSRKELNSDEPTRKNITNYGREHSKWSIDVDGEGLTKVNIPASSETGNIPILGRHFTSVRKDEDGNVIPEERDSGSFRDPRSIDIRSSKFGQDAQKILGQDYLPESIEDGYLSTTGTAYHDLMNIAPLIMSSGKLRNPNPGVGAATVKPLSVSVDNRTSSENANAGGRSLSANLDGSLEISIGSDTVDGKSLVMDLEGGIVSHVGKDNNGRGIIHQSDGDVIMQIGGEGINDSGFRPGRMEIRLARENGEPQKIIIDENGITISVEGNAVYSSTGHTTISAGGNLLLHGENIYHYGAHDEDTDGTRAPTGTEKLIIRNGRQTY